MRDPERLSLAEESKGALYEPCTRAVALVKPSLDDGTVQALGGK